MDFRQHLAREISAHSGRPFHPTDTGHIAGGCINQALKLSDGEQHWFVKTNSADLIDMFEAEAEGLNALAASHTIKAPQALCSGVHGDTAYIVIDYIAQGRAGKDSSRLAGEQLAAMHRCTADRFGWHRDNTIGATAQHNAWHDDWIDFWREQRLGFQLELAARNGHRGRLQSRGEQLLARFSALIDHAPDASLLHGDLWGGNMLFDQNGQPVIFDPAVYYGDREAELAMTELFGGFSADFYAAYNAAWPLDDGYRVRKQLYNLYHILNHLNLFGSGYAGQAQSMIDSLLSQC